MNKMDFCPYDGKTIDLRNLAYELVFSDEWTWNRVKEDTIVGNSRKLYINENDSRRIRYKDLTEELPVILLESRTAGGKNGIELLCDYIRQQSPSGSGYAGSYEEKVRDWIGDVKLSADLPVMPGIGSERNFDENGLLPLFFSQKDGVYFFTDSFDELIMKAVPCCPHCHRRLPEGWTDADDFLGIAVLAPRDYGKKSFISSLTHNSCEAFDAFTSVSGRTLMIMESAGDGDDKVFLRASLVNGSESKTLMIGIYDMSGLLAWDGKFRKDTLGSEIMKRMDADLFMFDIRQMGIPGISSQKKAGRSVFSRCRLMTIKEQADFQKENVGKSIHASEVLKYQGHYDADEDEGPGIGGFYRHIVEERQKYERGHLNKMQFIGVITKSDLLEARENSGRFAPLFDRSCDYDMTDVNIMSARSELVQKLIQKYNMLDNKISYGAEYGMSNSWHCISSLGCDALNDGTLTGEYRPIRVTEPVMRCFMRRIAENEWI